MSIKSIKCPDDKHHSLLLFHFHFAQFQYGHLVKLRSFCYSIRVEASTDGLTSPRIQDIGTSDISNTYAYMKWCECVITHIPSLHKVGPQKASLA